MPVAILNFFLLVERFLYIFETHLVRFMIFFFNTSRPGSIMYEPIFPFFVCFVELHKSSGTDYALSLKFIILNYCNVGENYKNDPPTVI